MNNKNQFKPFTDNDDKSTAPADSNPTDLNPKMNDRLTDAPPMDPSPIESSQQVKVICSSLRVRKHPTKDSDILFMVKKDDLLGVIENEDTPEDWINMTFNQKSGWVMKEFTEEV